MVIRPAMAADNGGLVELQSRNPQGTNLVVRLDRAPDFFARSKPYIRFQTFLAEDGDRIVGAVETALKPLLIGEKEIEAKGEEICLHCTGRESCCGNTGKRTCPRSGNG